MKHNAPAPKKSFWISTGTILGIIALYYTYISTGADTLRAEIYQPLYREVIGMDSAIHANNMETNYSSDVYQSITKNGNLGRIPKPLRDEIVELYKAEGETRSYFIPIAHRISVLMPDRIAKIRTESDDKIWKDKTVAQLNADMASDLSRGSFPMASFNFNHAGVGPSIDIRDPAHPKIASPAAITWLVNDWMEFPRNIPHMTDIWPNSFYLTFDERNECWNYCITRDDLAKNHMSLEEFLTPIYRTLANDSDFQKLLSGNQGAIGLLEKVELSLADRVKQPKQLTDLMTGS